MSFTRTLRAVGGAVVAGALLFGTAPVAAADQIRDAQWPLQGFKAEEVWNISTGKGVTVAVIDDGVNSQHPDLQGNVLPGKGFMDGDGSEPQGGDTHGTQMAAIIAGHGHGPGSSAGVKGLAPDAKILPLRDNGLRGDGFSESIRYAVNKGASVINISQTGSSGDGETDAISYALKHNVLIVAGAGNEGKGGPDAIQYPARYPGVLAVGGVKSSGEIWSGSNYGPQVLLTAPAVGIVSAGSSGRSLYQKGTGTSDATAFVSAAAALLRAKFPDLSAGQIVNRLTKTAGLPQSAKGASLPDQKYGYGFIQPLAALTRDIPAGSKDGPMRMPKADSSQGAENPAASQGSDGKGSGSQPVKEVPMSPLFIALIAVAGLVVVGIIVAIVLVVRRKGRRNGPPPSGPGGPGGYGGYSGGPGGPGFAPQQPNPYQQQPSAPNAYPPAPPMQPPGQ
ncbi:type VII secretion-associated serine protease mycosin [Streptomyces celluloflavus]|uniref:type VII secretion-associated serine protease mycosin n=1 Tax=Streptomyces celluloflavus TaxID=58344 RepID=UPI0034613DF2|nr:type VII secretion-associated serine protease mycosin [Streptomyces celluloflavus]